MNLRYLSLLACILLLPFQLAFAEMTPEGTVQEILGKIKAAANPSPVVEYVDWESAYKKMPAVQRSAMGIDSATSMKSFYKTMLEDPSTVMKQKMEQQLASMPADQQSLMKASMGQMQEMLKKRQAEMKKQIAETKFNVGESKIEGTEATVEISQSYNGETKEREIKLSKIEGRWLLDSASMFDQRAPVPAGAASASPVPNLGEKLKAAAQQGAAAVQ